MSPLGCIILTKIKKDVAKSPKKYFRSQLFLIVGWVQETNIFNFGPMEFLQPQYVVIFTRKSAMGGCIIYHIIILFR